MSESERRRMVHFIMKEAWNIAKSARLTIDEAVKISWGVIRSKFPVKYTKIKGVSHENRQQILREAMKHPGQYFLECRREANPYDENAISVELVTLRGYCYKVGYFSRERAAMHAFDLDNGKRIIVLKHEITGQNRQEGYLGLNIQFVIL